MTLELGTTNLSEARLARGLTLEDAERGTRISRRFLIALEEHNYSVFPAPVYARGFLRTYCRYLGLDAEPHLEELPAGWSASTPTTHLPPVSRGPMTLNVAWVFAGALIAVVVAAGIFLSRDTDGIADPQAQQEAQGEPETASEPGAASPEAQPTAVASAETPAEAGRALDPGIAGILPDFLGVEVDDVTSFLGSQGLAYLRIDARSSTTPAGLVISQSPPAGTGTEGLERVTLTVSAGSTLGAARTDCAVLEASNHRTIAEQTYLETNCGPETADRTDCEEVRGTDYRSPAERSFFLANCVTQ